jgi:hypothetical protein
MDFTQHVRLNLKVMMLADKKSKLNMAHKWNHTTSILTNIDSMYSNSNFPTLVKQYYRPQLQSNNHHVEDSFLISSFDATREFQNPQFAKLNESVDLNAVPHVVDSEHTPLKHAHRNKVNVIRNSKHPSITFASIFKNGSMFSLNNQGGVCIVNENKTEDNLSTNTLESELNDANSNTRSERCF